MPYLAAHLKASRICLMISMLDILSNIAQRCHHCLPADLVCVSLQTVPYSVWDNSTAKGAKLLRDAHSRLMAYHANASIELPTGTADRLPTQAVVAFWDPSITWIGGGWSSMKVSCCTDCPCLILSHASGCPPELLLSCMWQLACSGLELHDSKLT